jgi:hypothetical protein
LASHHDDRIFRPNQIWVQGYQWPLHFILLLQFLIHMHSGHNLKFPFNCSQPGSQQLPSSTNDSLWYNGHPTHTSTD